MMRSAHNPLLFWYGASDQRLGDFGADSGNGDPAGAAAVLGCFGFFGFSIFRAAALGGGAAG
jgi:hypothetical protein